MNTFPLGGRCFSLRASFGYLLWRYVLPHVSQEMDGGLLQRDTKNE
jgi:hypothetical protein